MTTPTQNLSHNAAICRAIAADLPAWLGRRPELAPFMHAFAGARFAPVAPATKATPRRYYFATLARNTQLLQATEAVLAETDARGITLLPMKGALFADSLYPDPGTRPMTDIDILVRPTELDAALAALGHCGFRRAFPRSRRYDAEHGHDVTVQNSDGTIFIELHYKLFHELGGDPSVDQIFANSVRRSAFGEPRPCIALDDHLFIVAVHAATHAFAASPMWVIDIALLIDAGASLSAARAEAVRRRYRVAFDCALQTAARALPSLAMEPVVGATAIRAGLLDRLLGTRRLAQSHALLPSLLARSILTDDPKRALAAMWHKSTLRAHEMVVEHFAKERADVASSR